MTHREKIRQLKRLTFGVCELLQKFYPEVSLIDCPIIIRKRPGSDDSSARTGITGVVIWDDVWCNDPAPNVLAILCHELTHWEQAQTRGWLSVTLCYIRTHIASWLHGRWYDDAYSPDERAAQARQQRIKGELTNVEMSILDREV